MTTKPTWQPSLKFHAKLFCAVLAVCLVGYLALSYWTSKLPAPYQKRHPAAEATPWLNK